MLPLLSGFFCDEYSLVWSASSGNIGTVLIVTCTAAAAFVNEVGLEGVAIKIPCLTPVYTQLNLGSNHSAGSEELYGDLRSTATEHNRI